MPRAVLLFFLACIAFPAAVSAQQKFASKILQPFLRPKAIADDQFSYPFIPASYASAGDVEHEPVVSKSALAYFVLDWTGDYMKSAMIIQSGGKRYQLQGGRADYFLKNTYSGAGFTITIADMDSNGGDGAGTYFPRVRLVIRKGTQTETVIMRCLYYEGT